MRKVKRFLLITDEDSAALGQTVIVRLLHVWLLGVPRETTIMTPDYSRDRPLVFRFEKHRSRRLMVKRSCRGNRYWCWVQNDAFSCAIGQNIQRDPSTTNIDSDIHQRHEFSV